MEIVDMESSPAPDFSEDFSSSVLSQFGDSNIEHHLRVCATIGAMSQELREKCLPLTPITYFGATCSSLDRLASSIDSSGSILDALLTILSLVVVRLPPAVLKSKHSYLSELLIKILGLKTVGVEGVVPGLKFVARLVIVSEKESWEDVAELYGVLIGYMTDDRFKIRRRSHLCLRDVLKYFQSAPSLSPLLAFASEAITNVFVRFLLLAGGSNENVSEVSGTARNVLRILDALKICLPYMSSKSTANILERFKSLLTLKQRVVTTPITDGLKALCLHPGSEISAETLLDLLCFLASSGSPEDSSADTMTPTIRLLDIGMKRVYSLNRQICVIKLPLVFNALKDFLTSGHEESLVAAVTTLKSLIHSCIDENMIKQGVEQITASANSVIRKSGPTLIEKICATIESLLDYQYEAVWDMSFQIVSTMFEKLGKNSVYFMEGTLKSLADMQKLPEGDFGFKKELHECVGTALGAMGPENFLSLLPLNLGVPDLSESNLWLFPILKQYIVGARLNFFTDSILPMATEMKRKSAMLKKEGKLQSARSVDGIVYSLWSLLPSFCNYPVDTAASFKSLEGALCTALQEEHELRGIICSSLQNLIHQNKRILEGKGNTIDSEISLAEQQAAALYTENIATSNLNTLKSSDLLRVLAGVYFKCSKDTAGILQTTIRELASILDKEVVSSFFKQSMKKLVKVTLEANKSKNEKNSNLMQIDDSGNDGSLSAVRVQLFDVAVSLLPGLGPKEIDILFEQMKHALKDADSLIQKKAYRVLSLILQYSNDFISRKLDEVLSLMVEVLPSCHFAAKRHRLDCLYFVIVHISKEGYEQRRRDITASFLTEIILALKETNKKTRNRAYDVLVQIGHACEDEEKCGKETLQQFFAMVAGGLAGETPHMISAAMTGLARLAYEFSDLVSAAYNVLPSTFLLLQRKNKEITKANLGLLKVLVAKSQAEALQGHLRGMVEGMLNWKDSSKNHFKAKVKQLLEMLVKKCGMDAVKQVMPDEHMKLLTNIRKLNERKEKKQTDKSSEDRSVVSRATTARMSRWNHTKIFSDFDDEDTRMSGGDFKNEKSVSGQQSKYSAGQQSRATLLRSKKARKVAKQLEEESFDQLDDEPLDMLDGQKMRTALRSSAPAKMKSDSDDEPSIDDEGRMIIHEEGKYSKSDRKHKREASSDGDGADGRSRAGSHVSGNTQKTQKRMKTSTESGWAYTGKEYASKKAGGDVKRKDKLEPYAYWPLDRKMVSRRPEHRASARSGMARVVKLTKKMEGKSVSHALSIKGAVLKRKKKGGK
ncbi:RRP12-like protein [Salvia splendens]|uniref:RRP12-like protein n=1 Tax=Salvia splendens TaxID=180675 RepID=UPI001C25EEBA|nr:RRP12-like protein [Salvia splendens]